MGAIQTIGKITREQTYTAYKRDRREYEIEQGINHRQVAKVHATAKDYNRRTAKNVSRYMDND